MYTNKSPSALHRTNARITSFHFVEEEILLIINNLVPAKAHGCDSILIKMIKIFSESITIPLRIIF